MFSAQRVFFSDQNLVPDMSANQLSSNSSFLNSFKQFIAEFSKDDVRIYHRQLLAIFQQQQVKFYLPVMLSDIKQTNQALYQKYIAKPLETLAVMDQSVKNYVLQRRGQFPDYDGQSEWHVIIKSDQNPRRLRDINSSMVGKSFAVNGIIISASKPCIKASKLRIQCRSCNSIRTIDLTPGQQPHIPTFCTGQQGQPGNRQKCPNDPFVALPDSKVIDFQTMKIQENPQQIPTGQIPRTYTLVVDRYNVGKCVPGDRVKITGIMLTQKLKTEQLQKGYLYVTGIQKLKERSFVTYTQKEEQIFKNLSTDPKIFEKIYKSIAPGIFGNQEIKKAIACMLFGGSRKHLPDNTTLRGDINVLLIGDPSTAKSQFLKFVEQTSAIAVYTSGKGSSAAGLTASISKDPSTGQFQIQGGALVLADGGIVCIDQFDKMKPADRVAIHEAMQQQTISVAKAGITTRLNSRTSVLAAANPIHGRYDDFKQVSQQIEFQTTILSRFDCIFVVRDINTNQNNSMMADHILNIHQGKIPKEAENAYINLDLLKKYISYARSKVSPRLSQAAASKISTIYVNDRQIAQQKKTLSKNRIPITVRQLEAIIRLSESLAKMRLKTQVTPDDVDAAHHLFEISTMKSIDSKETGIQIPEDLRLEVSRAEDLIRKRVPQNTTVSQAKLISDLTQRISERTLYFAISQMVKSGQFKEVKGNKLFTRVF